VRRHAPDAIEQVARENRSVVVIVDARARAGLKRLLIGNTAARVLDQLNCDVLWLNRFHRAIPRRSGAAWRDRLIRRSCPSKPSKMPRGHSAATPGNGPGAGACVLY
jgi:hypothetical protein